jgi:putative phosphoribosyl transferase
MIFRDRNDAALQLADELDRYRGRNPLILAIPRGAVPMGEVLAEQLDGELDVVLVRKLRAPFNPEFAIGAVSESGWKDVADYAAETGADEDYLRREVATQLATLSARRQQLRGIAEPIDPEGRIVIVVDDGLATGYTMVAALQSVRAAHPAHVVCAVPVASRDALVKGVRTGRRGGVPAPTGALRIGRSVLPQLSADRGRRGGCLPDCHAHEEPEKGRQPGRIRVSSGPVDRCRKYRSATRFMSFGWKGLVPSRIDFNGSLDHSQRDQH